MSETLLVDAGNTRLKWAFSQAGVRSPAQAAAHHAGEDLGAVFAQWAMRPAPTRVLLASVASPALAEALGRWWSRHWGVEAEVVESRAEACGVRNAYAEPRRLGVDRWAAMIGARRRFSGPLCVVDCGTATTIDVVDAAGRHLGGLIAPGPGLMRAALQGNTAAIGAETAEPGDDGLASDTASAVSAGALAATAGLVERVVRQAEARFPAGVTAVLCGGYSADLIPLLQIEYEREEFLVLDGLNVMAEGGQ